MPAGLEIEAISVSEVAGESWVFFRVPGYEHVEDRVPGSTGCLPSDQLGLAAFGDPSAGPKRARLLPLEIRHWACG